MPDKSSDPFVARELTVEERDKATAEAERARAEADKFAAESRKFTAEAVEAEAKAATAKIALEVATEKRHRDKLADDFDHHRYLFDGVVSDTSIKSCIKQLNSWNRENPDCDIEVVFSSPGGFVMDGMELFDYLVGLRHPGRVITTSTYGMAASMAGILLQAGDIRVAGAQAYILIHEVSGGTGGKTSEIEDEVKFMQKIQKRVVHIFADRCQAADPATATNKLTARKINQRWQRRDWWIDSDEALTYGLVDEVR